MCLLVHRMEDEKLSDEMKQKVEHLIVCCLQPPPKADCELRWAKDVLMKHRVTASGNLRSHAVTLQNDKDALFVGIHQGLFPPPPGTCQDGEWPPTLHFPAILMCTTGKLTWNIVALAANKDSVSRLMYIMTSLVHEIDADASSVPLSLQPAHRMLKARHFWAVFYPPRQLSQDPAKVQETEWESVD